MIDSKTLTYEPFHDSRKDEDPEFEEGFSGKLFLAKDKNGKKYIVKHTNYTDAANEFIGCWLAEIMGVLAPKAHLLTPNPIFNCPCAVAIEFLDGLTRIPKDADRYETAAIFALHTLLANGDAVPMEGLNGHICTYDFSDCFRISDGHWNSRLAAEFTLSTGIRSYRAYLDFTKFDFSYMANNRNLDPVKYNKLAVSAAQKILDVPGEEYAMLFDELSKIYPEVMVEYYSECLEAMQEKVNEIQFLDNFC